jgi:hypothetical protein
VGLLYLSVAVIISSLAKRWEKKRVSHDLIFSLANA